MNVLRIALIGFVFLAADFVKLNFQAKNPSVYGIYKKRIVRKTPHLLVLNIIVILRDLLLQYVHGLLLLKSLILNDYLSFV